MVEGVLMVLGETGVLDVAVDLVVTLAVLVVVVK